LPNQWHFDALNLQTSHATFISDVKASRAAGFKVICMSYGYNHGDDRGYFLETFRQDLFEKFVGQKIYSALA
jgi:hypothetical protein